MMVFLVWLSDTRKTVALTRLSALGPHYFSDSFENCLIAEFESSGIADTEASHQ